MIPLFRHYDCKYQENTLHAILLICAIPILFIKGNTALVPSMKICTLPSSDKIAIACIGIIMGRAFFLYVQSNIVPFMAKKALKDTKQVRNQTLHHYFINSFLQYGFLNGYHFCAGKLCLHSKMYISVLPYSHAAGSPKWWLSHECTRRETGMCI